MSKSLLGKLCNLYMHYMYLNLIQFSCLKTWAVNSVLWIEIPSLLSWRSVGGDCCVIICLLDSGLGLCSALSLCFFRCVYYWILAIRLLFQQDILAKPLSSFCDSKLFLLLLGTIGFYVTGSGIRFSPAVLYLFWAVEFFSTVISSSFFVSLLP